MQRAAAAACATGIPVPGWAKEPQRSARPGPETWVVPSADQAAAGRAMLEARVARHGGREAWMALPPSCCDLTVEVASGAKMVLPSMPRVGAGIGLAVDFQADKVRLDFHDATETCWGYDSREGWSSEHGRRTYSPAHALERVVQGIAWYASMPHKLLDPGVLHTVLDRNGEHIAVGFGTAGGQTGDRMWATFASDRLIRLRHTAYGIGETILVSAEFEHWEQVETVLLPGRVRVSLESPVEVGDVQVLTMRGWRLHPNPTNFFEKPY